MYLLADEMPANEMPVNEPRKSPVIPSCRHDKQEIHWALSCVCKERREFSMSTLTMCLSTIVVCSYCAHLGQLSEQLEHFERLWTDC